MLELNPSHVRGIGSGEARLIQGDCISELGGVPSQSVDLVFADPPYNLSNGGSTCRSGSWASVDKGQWDVSNGLSADSEFHLQWLAECKRVLKPNGTIWVSGTQHVIFVLGYAMQQLDFHLLNTVTWFKPNASPNLSRRYLTHSSELLIWASPHRRAPLAHTFNYAEMRQENGGKQMRDVWTFPTPAPWEKLEGRHPTQKPVRLLDRIVRLSTSPGDLVLDPFTGSGTTGVAALANGRRFLGIDTDEEFLEVARRRLTHSSVASVRRRLAAPQRLFAEP